YLIGAIVELLARFRELGFLALNHLLLCLELFGVGLGGEGLLPTLDIAAEKTSRQGDDQHGGRPDKLRRKRKFARARRTDARLAERIIALQPLRREIGRQLGLAIGAFWRVFRDAVGAVRTKPRSEMGFCGHGLLPSFLRQGPRLEVARPLGVALNLLSQRTRD